LEDSKIACIDVGEKRIGLAFYINGVILPQNAIFRKNRNQASSEVKALLDEWGVDVVVVGALLVEVVKMR